MKTVGKFAFLLLIIVPLFLFYILSGADVFRLIYKDPTIRAYYQALDRQPEGIGASKLVIYTAKFPY